MRADLTGRDAHASRTPHLVAQHAAAERLVLDLLESWGSPHAQDRATVIVTCLVEQLQWGPPRSAVTEDVPTPRGPGADPAHVAACKAEIDAAIDAARRRRQEARP